MDSKQYFILWMLYNQSVYKFAIAIDRDHIPLRGDEELVNVWREAEVYSFLEDQLPEHVKEMPIVGIEEIHGIL